MALVDLRAADIRFIQVLIVIGPRLITTVVIILNFLRRGRALISPVEDDATLSHVSVMDRRWRTIALTLNDLNLERIIVLAILSCSNRVAVAPLFTKHHICILVLSFLTSVVVFFVVV